VTAVVAAREAFRWACRQWPVAKIADLMFDR
jgi:hypothetical protein